MSLASELLKKGAGVGSSTAKKIISSLPGSLSEAYTTGAASRAARGAAKAEKRLAANKSILPSGFAKKYAYSLANRPVLTGLGTAGAGLVGYTLASPFISAATDNTQPVDLLALSQTEGDTGLQKRIDAINAAYAQDPQLQAYLSGANAYAGETGGNRYDAMGKPELGAQYRIEQQGKLQQMLLADQLQRNREAAKAIANAKLASIDTTSAAPLVTQEMVAPIAQNWDQAGEESQKAWAQANGYANLADARNAYIKLQLGI